MSMSTGGGRGLTNEPNVTPMIDVLLVLLIIFMMIIPLSRKAIDLQLPDPNPLQTATPDPSQIVLEIAPGGVMTINKTTSVTMKTLGAKLHEIYDPRPDKILFFRGDSAIKYQDAIEAMDIARGAGVKVIGITPKESK